MPKFMVAANYSKEALAGILRDGGSSRTKVVQAMAESVGGRLESIYWALGDTDVYVIFDADDAITAAAIAAKVGATGTSTRTTLLLTADDVDAMAAKSQGVEYSPPGS